MLGDVVHIYVEPTPVYDINFCDDNSETLAWITLILPYFNKVDFNR